MCDSNKDRIKVAVITGNHPHDVISFQRLFRSMPEIEAFPQSLEDFAMDTAGGRDRYDALVFYNFHQKTPSDSGDKAEQAIKKALERLQETGQGIVVLHHGLVAFRQWELWSSICGVWERGFGYFPNEKVDVWVEDGTHPIVAGLKEFSIVDETYTIPDAEDGSQVLLRTDHPNSIKTIAWTRWFGSARVFCFQSGHDNTAYSNQEFRQVLSRGIQWAAGKI